MKHTKTTFYDHLATVVLVMILTVQIIHTTGLYMTYTRLGGMKADLVGNFISITIELLVIILVEKGKLYAGAWFAIMLFFVGILYNRQWSGIDIQISFDPFSIDRFYIPVEFTSSTLMQFLSSVGIWLLTIIRHEKKRIQDANTILQQFYRREQASKKRLQESTERLQRNIDINEQLLEEIEEKRNELKELEKEKTKVHSHLTAWREEIQSLKKAKPRLTGK